MVLTAVGSPLQTHLMIALIANPSVQSPCNIGRGNLQRKLMKQSISGVSNQY